MRKLGAILIVLTTQLGLGEEIAPLLGAGFGKIVEIEGKLMDGDGAGRKAGVGEKFIEVKRVGESAFGPVVMKLEAAPGLGNAPAGVTVVRCRGYETGGFCGIPRAAMADLPEMASAEHGFQSVFAVTRWLEVKEAAAGVEEKPSREAATVLAKIEQLAGGLPSYPALVAILGKPDADVGSGLHIYVFGLSDGSKIAVATADGQSVFYVDHNQKRLYPAVGP